MNSIFHWLCNPFIVFTILLLTSLILKILKRDKISFQFLSAGIIWMLLVSTTPLPQWLVYTLEKQYKPFNNAQHKMNPPVYILILGGGHTISPDLPASQQLSGTAVVRLAEGIRIHNQLAGSKLVCSGYSASGRTTQAEMLARAAIDLGVSSNDTLQLRSPGKTAEEIRAFKKRFGAVPLVVVTSASHMSRVMMICEQEVIKAIPGPTDFYSKPDSLYSNFNFYPSTHKLLMFETGLHEFGGMIKEKISY